MTTTEIKTFSQALPILAAHGYSEPESIGNRLWRVGYSELDKGGVVALANELIARASAPPALTALTDLPRDLPRELEDRARRAGVNAWKNPDGSYTTANAAGRADYQDHATLDALAAYVSSRLLTYAATTEITITPAGIHAGALSVGLQERAIRYVAARRASGEALLEAIAELAAARQEAQHGEWGTFLQAIGLDESGARKQLRIHEEVSRDPAFAERIRSGWLSAATAGELLAAPPDVQARILAQPEPPSRREIKAAKRGPVPVLPDITDAEKAIAAVNGYEWERSDLSGTYAVYHFRALGTTDGMRMNRPQLDQWLTAHAPYTPPTPPVVPTSSDLADALLDRALFNDVQQRFAAIGWDLRHAITDRDYGLYDADGNHYATTPTLAPHIRALERFERAGVGPAPARRASLPCATCGAASTTRRTIGGVHEPRCDACTEAAEQQAAEDAADVGTRSEDPAWCGRAETLALLCLEAAHGYDRRAAHAAALELGSALDEGPAGGPAWPPAAVESFGRLYGARYAMQPDPIAAIRAALELGSALAPTELYEIADALDDRSYVALAAYRRCPPPEEEAAS